MFFLEGVSVTVFVAFMFLDVIPGMIAGVLLLIAAVILLLSHLGHPFRAWMAIRNFRRSVGQPRYCDDWCLQWAGIAYIAAPALLQLDTSGPLLTTVARLLIVAGVFILLYPGFAMSASPAIPFWSSGLLPVLSAFNGLASGIVVVLLYVAETQAPNFSIGAVNLIWLQQTVMVVLALCTFAYMVGMSNSGTAAKLSVAYLVQREPILFWLMTVGAGIVVPIVVVAITLQVSLAPYELLWVAVVARLVGDVCGRYAWLKAGIYDAVLQSHRRV